MAGLLEDIRFGFRMLVRARGVSLVAIVLLALGIGANTAIFSLIHGILMRPAPGVRDAGSLVRLMRVANGQRISNFGYPDYVDFRDQTRLLSGVVAESRTPLSFADGTTERGATERIRGSLVSGNYFSVLGVRPAAGRLFTTEDNRVPGAHWVAVISHAFWKRTFAADAAAVGKILTLNGHEFHVVGVATEDFQGIGLGQNTDVWLPLMMQPQAIPRLSPGILKDRTAGWLSIYGRLKPGVRLEQARTEVAMLAERAAHLYPATNEGRGADVVSDVGLYPDERANLQRFFGMLFAAVGLVLLIACANVANLFLARATARRREISVRLALGAGRSRLVRQLLTESMMLCLVAAALGLLIAPWSLGLLTRMLPPSDTVLKTPPPLDFAVLGFTLALSMLTALLFGLAPAFVAAKTDLATSLKDAAPASGFQRSRLSRLLVIAQVSLSLVLLIGAGLVVQSIARILAIDRGFETGNVLLASFDLSILNYPETRARLFFERLRERLAAVPGVQSVSLSKTYPARDWSDRRSIFYEGQEPTQEELRRRSDIGFRVYTNTVSPGYFRTLGIPMVQGRDFTPRDTEGAPLVAIVTQKLAARLWPGENPLGKRIAVPSYQGPRRPPVQVIGVAKDSRYQTLLADAPLLLYVPLLQNHEVFVSIEVRTTGDAAAFAPVLEHEVAALDRNLPLYETKTLLAQIMSSLWEQRAAAGWIGLFAALSLALAGVGLYSVLAYTVSHRTREIGIRMALGAQSSNVLALVVRNGLTLAALGTACGMAVAAALTRFVSGFLYGITPSDPLTFVAVVLVLLLVSLAASYFPARAATRIDPLSALRHE